MSWIKAGRLWKIGVIAAGFLLLCGVFAYIFKQESNTVKDVPIMEKETAIQENAQRITEVCFELYETAAKENKAMDMETIRSIVKRLEENGYPAVDSKNQINMVNADQVIQFCESVDTKNEASLTMIEVTYTGGFVKYDLETTDGNVNVTENFYQTNREKKRCIFWGKQGMSA